MKRGFPPETSSRLTLARAPRSRHYHELPLWRAQVPCVEKFSRSEKLPCDVPNPRASNGKMTMPTFAGTATV
eukprot:1916371-Pyramimonas_sp.AAC.1